MSKGFISVQGVSKSLGGSPIIRDLNLDVPEGAVFAIVGNNGHGKSTLVRLISGILTPDQGRVHIMGHDMPKDRMQVLGQMGCLIDAPVSYPNLTATELLRLVASIKGCESAEIPSLLSRVGLSNVDSKKIGKFSLGMKQRLAIAVALIGKPRIVLLDEPTNALDPSGIREIRMLLARLPDEFGCTVVFTTHQLEEVEKVASHVARIHEGTVLSQVKVSEITERQGGRLEVESLNYEGLLRALTTLGVSVDSTDRGIVGIACADNSAAAELIASLVRCDVPLIRCSYRAPSVEDWFMGAEGQVERAA